MSPITSTRSLLPVARLTAESTALAGTPASSGASSLLPWRRTVGRARPPVVLLGVVVAGWAALVAAEMTGWGHLVHLGHQAVLGGEPGHAHSTHHHALGASSAGAALVAFVAAWELMIVAMMLPSALPMIGLHGTAAAAHDRPAAARGAFVAGYLAVWTVAGAVAFAGAAGLHRLVGATPGLAERPWLAAGALLVVAGVAQFLPLTQACLRACRHPYAWLLTRFRPGVAAAFRLGRDHGLHCLGCCWALMLVMFAVGVADLVWMAGLTGVVVYEKAGRRGERLAVVVGVVLVAGGVLVMLQPSLPSLPTALTGGAS